MLLARVRLIRSGTGGLGARTRREARRGLSLARLQGASEAGREAHRGGWGAA